METILITGGSGFLGRNLAIKLKQRYNVILGGRNNGNNQLAEEKTGCVTAPLDITNEKSLLDVVNQYKPSIIIHAAATKFVDISEKFPMECIDVNVLGSQNIARLAIEKGIKTVVGISTDKAAPPVGNIYGHSKAVMERLFSSLAGSYDTSFVCTRFGNIAWSTGSAFPIWTRMGSNNGIISSTGPNMRRFFFSVDQASDLVITAMENSKELNGGILSLKMKSAQISDILNVWKETYGIDWKQIEERPGDKIDEVLIGSTEIAHTKEIVLNGAKFYFLNFKQNFHNEIAEEISSKNVERLSADEIKKLITVIPKI